MKADINFFGSAYKDIIDQIAVESSCLHNVRSMNHPLAKYLNRTVFRPMIPQEAPFGFISIP
jgi:hypothetical protein